MSFSCSLYPDDITSRILPSSISFNNAYYVAGRIPKGYRLLVVEGKSGMSPVDSESYYFKLALESPRDPRLESVDVIRPESFAQVSLAAYDVIVLADVPTVGEREAELTKWVEAGGGLFLSAGSKWSASASVPLKVFRRLADKSGDQAEYFWHLVLFRS
jgi:hypothetical protein